MIILYFSYLEKGLGKFCNMKNPCCRLCAENKSLALQIDLYGDVDKLQEVKVKLKLLNIVCDLSNHEYIPVTVCLSCYNSLTKAFEFINKVNRAQTEISRLLKYYTALEELSTISNTVDNLESEEHLVHIKQEDLSIKEENVEDGWCNYLWMCSQCSKVCEDATQLRKHSIQEHDSCCAFHCADCTQRFDSYDLFVDHVRSHRTNLRNYCKFCNSFEAQESCVSHEKWHVETFDICQLCGETFTENESLSVLSRHKSVKATIKIKEELKKQKLKCESDDSLSSIGLDDDLAIGLVIPKKIETQPWNNYPWICRICDMAFNTVHILRSHMKTQHNRCSGFKCCDCNFKQGRNSFFYFIKHVGKHRENLSKICCYCNLQKTSFKDIQHHIKKYHHKSYYCKKCGELFKSEREQKSHIKKYKALKQIRNVISIEDKTCKICNKVLSTPTSLITHTESVHFGKKNFTCDQCGAGYYSNYKLQRHINTAHEIKKFLCKLCKKTFSSNYGLIQHIKFHSSEKPFSCEYCGLSFKLQSLLKNHKTIHLDVKPFTCQQCNKSFRLKKFLKRHEIIHTGSKPYSCKVCNVAYANRENCYNHMKKKHNIQSSNPKLDEITFDRDTEIWKNTIMMNGNKGKKRKKNVRQ